MEVAEVRLSPVHPTRKANLSDEGMTLHPNGIRMPDGWIVSWEYVVEFKLKEPVDEPAKPEPKEEARKPVARRAAKSTRRGRKARGQAPES